MMNSFFFIPCLSWVGCLLRKLLTWCVSFRKKHLSIFYSGTFINLHISTLTMFKGMTQSLLMLGLLWWDTFSTTTSEAISLAELFDDGAPVNHDLLRQFATANRDAIKMTKETTYLIAYITYTCVESWVFAVFASFFQIYFLGTKFFRCLASGNCQFGHVKEDFEANLDASFTPWKVGWNRILSFWGKRPIFSLFSENMSVFEEWNNYYIIVMGFSNWWFLSRHFCCCALKKQLAYFLSAWNCLDAFRIWHVMLWSFVLPKTYLKITLRWFPN